MPKKDPALIEERDDGWRVFRRLKGAIAINKDATAHAWVRSAESAVNVKGSSAGFDVPAWVLALLANPRAWDLSDEPATKIVVTVSDQNGTVIKGLEYDLQKIGAAIKKRSKSKFDILLSKELMALGDEAGDMVQSVIIGNVMRAAVEGRW